MATLTVEQAVVTGLAPTFNAAASGGDEFPNDGNTVVHVKNANVSVARQVTLVSSTQVGYLQNVLVGIRHIGQARL